MTLSVQPFFGFGANASPALMHALLGRLPRSQKAILPHYRLYVEPWRALPAPVRSILRRHWTPLFQVYVIRPKRGEATEGVLWQLTSDEFDYMCEWDLNDGRWTEQATVVCVTEEDKEVVAETNILPYWSDNLVIAPAQKRFLNPRSKMLAVGRYVHNLLLEKE